MESFRNLIAVSLLAVTTALPAAADPCNNRWRLSGGVYHQQSLGNGVLFGIGKELGAYQNNCYLGPQYGVDVFGVLGGSEKYSWDDRGMSSGQLNFHGIGVQGGMRLHPRIEAGVSGILIQSTAQKQFSDRHGQGYRTYYDEFIDIGAYATAVVHDDNLWGAQAGLRIGYIVSGLPSEAPGRTSLSVFGQLNF